MASRSLPISFGPGFVQSREIARVTAQVDELIRQGSTRSRLLKFEGGSWTSFRLEWIATRLSVSLKPGLEVFAVGPDGRVAVLTSDSASEEQIDPTPDGPPFRGYIRDMRMIQSRLYVCGMSRQVYRRIGPGRWERFDEGVVLPIGDLRTAGFNAMDGVDEDNILAVGYGGEIWRRTRSSWHQMESPTNLMLHRVRIADSGLAFASGQQGVVLREAGNGWQAVLHNDTDETLWGMELFAGSVFVSSDSAVFRLTEDGHLQRGGVGVLRSCGHLHAADGVMWSFGTKQVAWTDETLVWHDVTPG